MADPRVAQRRTPVAEPVPVEVYRRVDGHMLVHACPDDRRALPRDGCYVGRALLDDVRWSQRLGCPLRRAKAAVVPREFVAQLISEIQVIG